MRAVFFGAACTAWVVQALYIDMLWSMSQRRLVVSLLAIGSLLGLSFATASVSALIFSLRLPPGSAHIQIQTVYSLKTVSLVNLISTDASWPMSRKFGQCAHVLASVRG